MLAALRLGRPEAWSHDGLEECGLAIRSRTERTQVARSDPEPGQPRARARDGDVRLAVALGAAVRARGEQPEALELARELRADSRPLAELGEIDVLLLLEEVRPPPLPLGEARARELLADDAKRKELVALELEDPSLTVDVLVAEEPVCALRPPRRDETLVF